MQTNLSHFTIAFFWGTKASMDELVLYDPIVLDSVVEEAADFDIVREMAVNGNGASVAAPRVRKEFPETWIWKQLNGDGLVFIVHLL